MSQDYLMQPIGGWETINGIEVPICEYKLDLDFKRASKYLDWNCINDERTEARDLTSPYGILQYAVGYSEEGEDWFICFDHAILPDGRFVLDGTCNSDSGGFIMAHCYEVVSREDAPKVAYDLINQAIDLCFECTKDHREHDSEGWNQDPWYFVRSVAAACGIKPYVNMTWDERRFGEVPSF